jgi:uncharacterized membrane protein
VPLLVPLLLLLVFVAILLILPWSIVQRLRAGMARRRARPWLASLNALGLSLSATILMTSAALSNFWVPGAFGHALAGLAAGALLGMLGIKLTRWEREPDSLLFTPNRWLVLSVTVAVLARIAYGLRRGWLAWQADRHDDSWLAAAGLAGSLAAGALVIGYYLAYWTGVWWVAQNHLRPAPVRRG